MLKSLRESKIGLQNSGERGFTLTEATIAIVIAATLATVALVKTTESSRKIRAAAAAKKLVSDLQFAQETAMNLGREVQVRFDLANNRYRLTWSDGTPLRTPAGNRDYIVTLGSGNYRSVTLSRTDLPGAIIRFRPDGRPYHNNGVLTQSRVVAVINNKYEIVIQPRTGNIELRTIE